MGLFDLLTKGNNGNRATDLSKWYGATPPLNPLGTKQSTMHANGRAGATLRARPGYSLNGSFPNPTIVGWAQYDDGVPNPLPKPSLLDLDGKELPKYEDRPRK